MGALPGTYPSSTEKKRKGSQTCCHSWVVAVLRQDGSRQTSSVAWRLSGAAIEKAKRDANAAPLRSTSDGKQSTVRTRHNNSTMLCKTSLGTLKSSLVSTVESTVCLCFFIAGCCLSASNDQRLPAVLCLLRFLLVCLTTTAELVANYCSGWDWTWTLIIVTVEV